MTVLPVPMSFSSDVMGRVNNMRLAKTHALLPLFETIINSIQAVEDRKNGKGIINISILRNSLSQSLASDSNRGNANISGFIVQDNGIGFNPENLKSLLTADSTLKLSRGNKGIGRFLWLKVYNLAKVDSVYQSVDDLKRVVFDFTVDDPYISNFAIIDNINNRDIGTKVRLDIMKMDFVDFIPKTAKGIARKIVEHLLNYYALGTAPEIIIQDEGEAFDIKSIFEEEFENASKDHSIMIMGQSFDIKYLKNKNITDGRHAIFLCANQRAVKPEYLDKYIPDLKSKLGEDEAYFIQAYLHGKYLDKNANQERSQFDFPDGEKNSPSLDDIMNYISEDVKANFSNDLNILKRLKEDKIREFIYTEAPKYRPLLRDRYSALIDNIAPNLSNDKLEIELHKALSTIEVEIKQESAELLSRRGKDLYDPVKFRENSYEIIEKIGDVSIVNLAQHVVHRKLVIDLLEASLTTGNDGKYNLEESIHKIIHPLNTSSDQLHEDYKNLWLIDEKLTYHIHLASDKKLNSSPVLDTDSGKEPDIIGYFDTPHAFSEGRSNFQSIVLIEFKRPGKSSYSGPGSDPIKQIFNYAKIIRDGNAKDLGGRPIPNKNIPIYAYVICDFTPEFKDIAEVDNQLQSSYDGLKYYGYHPGLKLYIEAISFDALVTEAKQRNRVLFDKLNLPIE